MTSPAVTPPTFTPDATQSPEENLDRYWAYLSAINPTFTRLLRQGVDALIPLPETPTRKAAIRTKFHTGVAQALDTPPATDEAV
jgi:hypothetical protein